MLSACVRAIAHLQAREYQLCITAKNTRHTHAMTLPMMNVIVTLSHLLT